MTVRSKVDWPSVASSLALRTEGQRQASNCYDYNYRLGPYTMSLLCADYREKRKGCVTVRQEKVV